MISVEPNFATQVRVLIKYSLRPLINSFNKETKQMVQYVTLLQSTLTHIDGVDDELGLNSLTFTVGTKMSKTQPTYSFSLLSYLIIK